MAVRFETAAFVDRRFAKFGRLLGALWGLPALPMALRRQLGRGAAGDVWEACTQADSEHLEPEEIDEALGVEGGHLAMIDAHLAESTPEGVRVRGTRGRIEWLRQCRENSRLGVEARRRKQDNKEQPTGKPTGKPEGFPSGKPNEEQEQEQEQDLDQEREKEPEKVSNKRPSARDVREAAARIAERFNHNFHRRVAAASFEPYVGKALGKGFSEKQILAAMWYGRESWPEDHWRNYKPQTFLRLSPGREQKSTLDDLIGLAEELWSERWPTETPWWRDASDASRTPSVPPPTRTKPTGAAGELVSLVAKSTRST